MTDVIEVHFPIIAGGSIPLDHRYILYSAIKGRVDSFGGRDGLPWQLLPIHGQRQGQLLELRADKEHSVRLRIHKEHVGKCLKIHTDPLRLGNHLLILGEPTVKPIKPIYPLRADIVMVTSNKRDHGHRGKSFGAHIGKRLGVKLGHLDFGMKFGPRKTVHIAGNPIVGYSVEVHSLTEEESVMLQSEGIGEGRTMGCGVFEGRDQ